MYELYDKFMDWYNGGGIWLYSDPHFNDPESNILRPGYIGDDAQVKSINSRVGKNDTLIILGDVGDFHYVPKLHGYKVLITGNHDQGYTQYKRVEHIVTQAEAEAEDRDVSRYKEMYSPLWGKYYCYDNGLFDEVYPGPLWISPKILLSHEPNPELYALNIHGHTHGAPFRPTPTSFNLCAEAIDYKPVNLKWIVESGALKDIPSIHRATIDAATERARSKE